MTLSHAYRDGILCVEDVPVPQLAAAVGTPFYAYATAQLRHNYQAFAAALAGLNATIYYAIKANPSIAVTRTLAACGAGADITSAGELERALYAGIRPERIIFSGVGKQPHELQAALLAGIHQFNVESIPELRALSAVAQGLGLSAAIALRINPDVDARTHRKIATGETGTKFGIDHAQLDTAMQLATSLPGLAFKGFHVHIGSHLNDYEPFREAFTTLAELVRVWRGKGIAITRLDLGGGVGIPYDGESLPPVADYAAIVRDVIGPLGCELAFEPGRRLVGDAGMLVTRVITDKQGAERRFLIVDAGMNDLVRPAMYQARHSILPVRANGTVADSETGRADVVGPVCETGDLFGLDYRLPGVGAGDLIAILQAGAYGSAMAGTYNGRALIPEVMVSGSDYAVSRRRIAVTEQLSWESVPHWLADSPA